MYRQEWYPEGNSGFWAYRINIVFMASKTSSNWPAIRINGWRAKAAKKYKATANGNHSLPVAPNLCNKISQRQNYYLDERRPAGMESWNHSFKVDAAQASGFRLDQDTRYQRFEYIDVYYNRKGLHSKSGYLNPASFEAKTIY